jgi:hypothetical protein
MLNPKTQQRELAYIVLIDKIEPIIGSDNCESAVVGGWHIMVRKGQFKPGDPAIYFEIDSKVPADKECFAFLEKRHYKVKTQKFTFGGKGNFISQGLLMHAEDFGWNNIKFSEDDIGIEDDEGNRHYYKEESRFLTKKLGVTYADDEDNQRKAPSIDKYKKMEMRHRKLFKNPIIQWFMRYKFGRKIMFFFFGKKKDKKDTAFPTQFPYIKKTDQERCENMVFVLQDKTPYIRTQKCDGSSGTFILARKKKLGRTKYEFFVCSRNVRMLKPEQECFYGEHNYYWEVAIKYDIENKLRDYLEKHPELEYVCWQGEICAPKIQANAHQLKETHLYLFHMIDSIKGFYDIREAKKIWEQYQMEFVPIENELYILPDDFEEFKLTADGVYDASVCEGKKNVPREGFVYYKSTDPNFSFKNVSRKYLLKQNS